MQVVPNLVQHTINNAKGWWYSFKITLHHSQHRATLNNGRNTFKPYSIWTVNFLTFLPHHTQANDFSSRFKVLSKIREVAHNRPLNCFIKLTLSQLLLWVTLFYTIQYCHRSNGGVLHLHPTSASHWKMMNLFTMLITSPSKHHNLVQGTSSCSRCYTSNTFVLSSQGTQPCSKQWCISI